MSNGVFGVFAGVKSRSSGRRPSGSPAPSSAGAPRVQAVEALECRRLMAVTLLTNGNGDGTLDITVDAYGSYGGAAQPAGDALYDPIGPATAQASTFQSGVYFSRLDTYLTESPGFAGPGSALPPIAFTSTTTDTAVSTFTASGFTITLTQTVLPATATGSQFNQTYVLTNNNPAAVSFNMVRHVDGDLFFVGGLGDDFGGVSADGRFVFEFDTGTDPNSATAYMGITASGDGQPGGYTVQPYPYLDNIITDNGIPPQDLNQVSGDLNGDRLTDVGYDVTITLADLFTVAPGASVSYTTTTIFSQGSPLAVLNPGLFQFSVSAPTVDETAGTATFTVNRVLGNIGAVSVDYSVLGGTATAGADFTPVSGTLLFADQQTTATFTVPILDDTLVEGDETVLLSLANPQGGAALGNPRNVTLTILDNERAVQFNPQLVIVNEDAGTATLTVVRTGPLAGSLTVDYVTADAVLPPGVTLPPGIGPVGQATAEADYLPASGTLTFAEGQREATITVSIVNDFVNDEILEAFIVTLTNPVSTGDPTDLGPQNIAGVAIQNVDAPPTFFDITAFAPSGRIEALYLQANDELLASRAIDPANYDLFLHSERRFGVPPTRRRVGLRSVNYDAGLRTITLRPMQVLRQNVFYEVVVRGTTPGGVRGADQAFLDGNLDRVTLQSEDFIGYFGRGTSLQYTDRDGDRVKLGAARGGVIEVFRDATRDARQVRYVGAVPNSSYLFGTFRPLARNSDRVTGIGTLLLGGAKNNLSNPPFQVGNAI